ncbi:carboxypeptidase regulatory-like domain-containing protein [Chryseobacterium sp. A321]
MNPLTRHFVILFTLGTLSVLYAQSAKGFVSTEGVKLPGVLVMNMKTQAKVLTDSEGAYEIPASVGEELRFVKRGYERSALVVTGQDTPYFTFLRKVATLIEEVQVPSVRLSGDLAKDSKLLAKRSAADQVQAAVGLPQAPEKPREKAYTSAAETLLPMLVGSLNVHALYEVISGDGRRKKSLYEFEDRQGEINWVRQRLPESYFIEQGIPSNRIGEFLGFAFSSNPKVRTYARARNLSGVTAELETPIQIYLSRLKDSNQP